MELLAPAGGFEQALVSIKSGCDALYGGLKDWSARNRAKNLSLDEYRKLMEICRQKNIRFYLTINTLLTDSELEGVDRLLSSGDFVYPDGILVADIGLYSLLREKYPQIELHASTQLAAYSLEDVQYYESLGFKRIVLARELTLEEIKYIRERTKVELEVFVYGNQCVTFSGNCLWGGLLHSGSGNRGRCIGACCDLYKNEKGEIGNFFWSCNIGLFGLVRQLAEIGVDSIKIEGRVRPEDEIRRTVSKFRQSIDGADFDNDFEYSGYPGGIIPPEGAFHYFNPEIMHRQVADTELTKYDLLVEFRNEKGYYTNAAESNSKEYVFTLFTNEHKANELNARIRLLFESEGNGSSLTTIDYINSNGERTFFRDNKDADARKTKKQIIDIYNFLISQLKINIYECMTTLPAKTEAAVNIDWLGEVVSEINSLAEAARENNALKSFRRMPKAPKKAVIYSDSVNRVAELYEEGYRRFYIFVRNFGGLKEIMHFEDSHANCEFAYQLPYLDFSNQSERLYDMLRRRSVIITRFSQIALIRKYRFAKVCGDYMLNVWNAAGAKFLREHGVSCLIGHPEITVDEIRSIGQNSGMEMLVIKGGKIPLGYTRACFKRLGLCSRECGNTKVPLENIMKGGIVELVCNNDFGYRMIFSGSCFVSEDYLSEQQSVFAFVNTDSITANNIMNDNYPPDTRITYNRYFVGN